MLLDLAYPGTIDFDPSHSHLRELDIWRRVDHADDEASSVAVRDGVIVSACLIARELDTPLLYDIATAPEAQRQRLAALLLARSVDGLGQRGERSLLAWVTEGNVASERLLARRAFTAVTDPLDRDSARTLYRDIAAAQPSDLAAWLREAERSG
jgi:GNAT superfamily N-acetyltransferase